MSFNVDFPFPDEASRLRIWQSIWPPETPLDDELDLAAMARFTLSGGSIKNIAVAGAFFAAEENVKVATSHLLKAAKREFQKMGKTLSPAELNGFRTQGRLMAEATA